MAVSSEAAHPLHGWITHDGGDCPINRDSIVRFLFASGKESEREYRAGNFLWRRRGWDFDIKAYQVIGAPDGDGRTWNAKSGGY